MSHPESVMAVFSILERGKSKRFRGMMESRGIRLHLLTLGHGTASSEMMDILGLGTNDKDVMISLAPEPTVRLLVEDITKNLENSARYGGLMLVLRLSAINRLAAAIVMRSKEENAEKEETVKMDGEGKYNLILIAVNHGFADEVMETAKRAGATGGTVIKGRLAGAEVLKQLDDVNVEEEKEIITILSPAGTCLQIMNAVNSEFGLRTKAKGIVCAVPVEKALKI
ncbi:MAG: hypothetical protein IJC59_02245 [Lachnospiraceae bacterium]|nr:hypothetical protein [Lachnospiraceae bacterium]